jgi:hypothetical protein
MGRPNSTGIKWRSGSPEEKSKMREYQKSYKERNKEKYRKIQKTYELKTRYNLSYEEYEKMLEDQDGKCAICGNEEQLHVDHCHDTERVRGLLCMPCNIGLGMFRDNKDNLIKASEYVL